jgi:multidrug efflux pump
MMLPQICIRRPVLATVLSLIVILLGLVGYQRLSVREYPAIDPPVVSVTARYLGASAEIIETKVTDVLEDSLAGIEGIDFMTSASRQEQSLITMTFKLSRDPDGAAADVRDRVSRVRGLLPDDLDEPVIQKVEADAQPIIYLAFFSDRHSALDITDHVERYVEDRLQTVPGVAEVRLFGARRYAMRLWLDPGRLAAFELTPQDVETALQRQNVELPAGRIESRSREFTVLSETDLRTPEEFDNLILGQASGYIIRLKDVGRAEYGPFDERVRARFNGRAAVSVGVIKQATANPLEVAAGIRAALPELNAALPDGLQVAISHDKAVFIEESIKNVHRTLAEAVVLVSLIIFLFLRTLRATVVPLVTIPVSLIGAFALMAAFGFSLNTLTLLALVLAIGLVVDDAIVVLENIYRHVEDGMPPLAAAEQGTREIAFPVIAMTLTLAAVYLPIGFLTGTTGRLFTEFAWTLAGAVLVSGFVALTLSPMMCSRLLRREAKHGALYRAIGAALDRLTAGYRVALRRSLRARPLILLIGLGVAAVSLYFLATIKRELAPFEDQGTVVGIFIGPEGATLDGIDAYVQRLEQSYAREADVDRFFVIVGTPTVNQGISFVKMTPWDQRGRTQKEIAESLAPQMFEVPGLLAFPVNPPPLGQSAREKGVQLVIKTLGPFRELDAVVERIIARAAASGTVTDLDSDLKLNKPQIRVTFDRDKAADLGIAVETLGRTLETLLGGREVTRFKREGKQYEVVVQLAGIDRADPEHLRRIHVRARDGRMVSLANLVTLEETVAPRQLNHFDQMRSATITANIALNSSLGDALAALEAAARAEMPEAMRLDYAGQSREFVKATGEIYLTFGLALAFIYLVLAAQFESFRDPLIIMLTVPLSITGGLLGLWLSGGTLNIYSQVGLVTLIGLITKHGILIVEFANQLRAQGLALGEAVIRASELRLRPILMTTAATVFGAVPLAIASGAGAEARQDIGWVIVGGLTIGTFFTLFVIPTVYTYLTRRTAAVETAPAAPPHGAPSPTPAE